MTYGRVAKPVVVSLTAFLLAACQGQATATPSDVAGPSEIQIGVATSDFPIGQPRVPFILFSGAQRVADAQSVRLTAFDLSTATPTPGWSGEAVNYSDYEVPYWTAYPELPHAGYWGLKAEITLADGRTATAQFSLEARSAAALTDIGQRPPASQNRTLKTEPDIHKLTSGVDPVPGLYQMTVAEAMESGRPTVVTIATPAFCTSQLCAPVVSSVEAVYRELGDQANFIHLEVYKSFDPLIYSDELQEWELVSEPWTFVLDREGKITARLAGPVSPRELTEALTPLLP